MVEWHAGEEIIKVGGCDWFGAPAFFDIAFILSAVEKVYD
jgi:hypothetical protein